MKRITPLFLFALLLTACGGGLPPEAQSTASDAAKALASHDKAAFAKLVLPAQREGAVGLDDGYPVEVGKKPSELTLNEILDVQFFTDIKKAEVSEDGAELDDDTNGTVILSFDYDDTTFTSKTFALHKEGDAWLIDFKKTLKLWHDIDGANALSVMKMQK